MDLRLYGVWDDCDDVAGSIFSSDQECRYQSGEGFKDGISCLKTCDQCQARIC